MKAKSLVVFCGSKSGANPMYEEAAKTLGNLLAKNNIRLIYGGGNRGLMGAVANGVLENGGTVTGIIPEILNQWEQQHDEITELIVVENMHVRKRLLYEKADAAIILPGGFGTMDELFEILTWNQLSIHDKPIYLLNTAGFYDALLQHMQHMLKEGFLYTSVEKAVTVINSPEEFFK
jgi:uncharacterized protein (TIGR00730 family)